MANAPPQEVKSLVQEMELVEEGDAALTFNEALALIAGNNINKEPLKPPLKSDRRLEKPEITIGNLALRQPTGTKVTSFCDVVMGTKLHEDAEAAHKANPEAYKKSVTSYLNDTVFKLFAQGRYKDYNQLI